MNPLTKKLLALGASSTIAVTGAFLIDPWEANKNNAYLDMVGIATVCRGETKGVKLGDYRTDEQCDESTVKELNNYHKTMLKYVKVPLTPYEEIAYTSLIWNIGENGFRNSKSVLGNLNAGNHSAACRGILDWNKATFSPRTAQIQIKNGETCTVKDAKKGEYLCTVRGLTNRRNHEYEVCEGRDAKVNAELKELEALKKPSEAIKDERSELPPIPIETNAPSPPESVPEVLPSYEASVPLTIPECRWKFFNVCLKRD